jgi:hypothetical protein
MDMRRDMRASDADRQAVVARLSAALDEGRLSLHEYDERIAEAYRATTYGDLADLFDDLPPQGQVSKWDAAAVTSSSRRAGGVPAVIADMPMALKILWTVWLSVVAVNWVVWALVDLTVNANVYFWPIWVAGPPGAALLGATIGVTAIRRTRGTAAIEAAERAAEAKAQRKLEARRKLTSQLGADTQPSSEVPPRASGEPGPDDVGR